MEKMYTINYIKCIYNVIIYIYIERESDYRYLTYRYIYMVVFYYMNIYIYIYTYYNEVRRDDYEDTLKKPAELNVLKTNLKKPLVSPSTIW